MSSVVSSLIVRFAQARSGVAAVEFAIAAPMLLFGLIIMADLGLAIHERMNLDQAVRAGAEFVMKDISAEEDVKKLVIASATGVYSENPGDVESANRPNVTVIKTCECPDAPDVSVSCSNTLCSNNRPASVYYQLAASKNYEALVLPNILLSTEISVQTR